MSYRVRWKRKATNQLASAWMAAQDRDAVAEASHEIDGLLADDPGNQGESRPDGRRIMFVKPLAVIFRVDEAKQTVVVSHCHSY